MSEKRLFGRAIIRLSPNQAEGGTAMGAQDAEGAEPPENVVHFLQGLVTNDVAQNLPCWAGLLSAQGKTQFDFLVWPGEDGALLLDCEADCADALVRRLSLYRLRRKITIARDETLAVYWSADEAGLPDFPRGLNPHPDPRLPTLGYRWLGPVELNCAEVVSEQNDQEQARAFDPPDAAALGADTAWREHRLKQGVAEGNAELNDILWLETNAVELNGVSFEKGCYVGQENTARMNWRQKVNRRLVVVPLEASTLKRRKTAYEDLGLAVDHLRLDNIAQLAEETPAILPEWMALKPEE